jgi:hypothetical protein
MYKVLSIQSDAQLTLTANYTGTNSTTSTAQGSLPSNLLGMSRSITFSSQPGVFYQVTSVTDDTHCTLSTNYTGTSSGGTATAQVVGFGGTASMLGGGGAITNNPI